MKNHVLLAGLLLSITFTDAVQAQNRTLGVGVASPSPNAVLHVESPTANQGFIMPRLTTAQRTATPFVSALSSVDVGLMVFDTDLISVFIWNGSQWDESTVEASTTGTTGSAGTFQINNTENMSTALVSTTNGTGGAAKFKVTNVAGTQPALWAETNSNQPLSAPIFGLNTGTGDVAASFRINNAASVQPALFVETNGTGRGAFIRRTSTTGSAPGLYVTSASGHGVWADHNGTTGFAAIIQNINTANSTSALLAESIGSGASIYALKSTDAVGGEAIFAQNLIPTGRAITGEIVDATNTEAAILAITAGTGVALQGVTSTGFTAVHGKREGATNGNAGLFEITDAGNSFSAVQVFNAGTGSGANFEVINSSSGAPAVFATTAGLGSSFIANHTGSSGSIATFQNSGSNVARIDKTGQGFFNGGTQNSGADLAEMFDVEGSKNEYEPGDVLVISKNTDRTVEKSAEANSTRVAGVYATKPGVVLTEKNLDESIDALVPMGVVGVIPTKVCLENGAIKRGDLLVTSSHKGHAMKAIPANINGILIYPTGAILGKALENFSGSETGLIKVLVNVK